MKNKILLLLIIISSISFSQTETEKWGKTANPYLKNYNTEYREYSFKGESVQEFFTNSLVSLYWFFISDQDGDLCPFYPSCSMFFLQSVKKTSLPQGLMMAADRFTRDMNIFERRSKYPFMKNNRLYDPPDLYTLSNTHYPPAE